MGEGVFENCVNELDISVEPESYAQHWCEDNDIPYRFQTSPEKFTVSFNGTYKDGTYTITYCGICGYTGHDEIVYVPEGINGYPVTMIQDSAFLGAEFAEIIFPKTVERISGNACQLCMNLTEAEFLSDNLTVDRYYTTGTSYEVRPFFGCENLKTIYIPSTAVYSGEILIPGMPVNIIER